jgi:hypothetical protein
MFDVGEGRRYRSRAPKPASRICEGGAEWPSYSTVTSMVRRTSERPVLLSRKRHRPGDQILKPPISKRISIQARGFGGITPNTGTDPQTVVAAGYHFAAFS